MNLTDEELQKCRKSLGFIATNFNRRISIRITKQLAKTNVTPNQITVISFFVGIVAAVLLATGQYLFSRLWLFLSASFTDLDCVDGEIARLKKTETRFGDFLDSILIITRNISIIFGVAFGRARYYISR